MTNAGAPRDKLADIAALVSHAASGDHTAYARLIDLYKDSLYRFALQILRRPQDAEDAVQDAFIRAYTRFDQYDPSYSFYTWISAILTNLCLSSLRSRDWQVSYMGDEPIEPARAAEPYEQPEVAALLQSRDEVVQQALATLPDKYRQILLLRYWSDFTYQEVANATNQSLGAVKTQIRRATMILRESLAGHRLDLAPEPA